MNTLSTRWRISDEGGRGGRNEDRFELGIHEQHWTELKEPRIHQTSSKRIRMSRTNTAAAPLNSREDFDEVVLALCKTFRLDFERSFPLHRAFTPSMYPRSHAMTTDDTPDVRHQCKTRYTW
ncbi:hypothetical protein CERSUDRAFT_119433 [Gelatoporia subvermispora B]|uniref:Uncharacterized protein n=1 Tax=Ceriporiopsis subvermispora (strain B) TaxID=914234 RepID=M2QHS0_CERS8|nr:hypothetical protein CERSUDRAFT_119433 [Gelatoporia subvermispora B]